MQETIDMGSPQEHGLVNQDYAVQVSLHYL
jgi:hypothetical protein